MSDLDHLRSEVERLADELREARNRLREAEIAASEFQVGDEVEARLRGGWVRAIVRQVEPQSWGSSWYRVSTMTKKGDWSKTEQHAFGHVRAVTGSDQ